jgi:hypothetical protein
MSNTPKWTQELRNLVYRRLKQQFGPYAKWKRKYHPPATDKEYEAALREIANFISGLTGESFAWTAVKQQVHWAIGTQSQAKSKGYARQYIPNKASALEAGFLTSSDLPLMMSMKQPGKHDRA